MLKPVMQGIDISYSQGDVDFKAVKNAGKEFVIVRAGYGDSITQKDKKFEKNMSGALAAGLHVGAYWFSYAISPDDAKKEAEIFASLMNPYKGKVGFPLCYDWENDSVSYAKKRGANTDRNFACNLVDAFLGTLKNYGWYGMNYQSKSFMNTYFKDYTNYDIWLADYSGPTSINCGIQQSSETGKIAGLSQTFDLDVAYKDYPALIRSLKMNGIK